MGQYVDLSYKCLRCIGCNVSHIKIIQEFDKFYVIGVQ